MEGLALKFPIHRESLGQLLEIPGHRSQACLGRWTDTRLHLAKTAGQRLTPVNRTEWSSHQWALLFNHLRY
jgi:hypothetical protein